MQTDPATPAAPTVPVPLFVIRAIVPTDMSFVFNSFLKTYRDAPATSGIPNGLYYAAQHRVIEGCLARPGAVALAAVSTTDSDQIYGYALGERFTTGTAVHWVYTKHPFRSFGIAKTLVAGIVGEAAVPVYVTHRMRNFGALVKNRPFIYNPYILVDHAV